MSFTRNIQVLAAAATIFAFSVIAAASALAAGDAPRWTISGATPTSGNTAFTGVSTGSGGGAPGKLEIPGLFVITYPANKCTITGNIAGSAANTSGTVNNVSRICEVQLEGLPQCAVEDEADTIPGTSTMTNLHGTTVWLEQTGDRTGLTLTPEAGKPFASITITEVESKGCVFTGLTVKVEGSMVAEVEAPGTDASTQALNFPNPPITATWSSATPRVPAADGLKVAGKTATFTNTFDITLTGSSLWGVETG
jgi:hypothetical protein